MANLWVTSYCNLGCEYCLAYEWLDEESESATYLSLEDLDHVIDWIKSYESHFQLMGGEPLKHPRIMKIVRRILQRQFTVKTILTNGLVDPDLVSEIQRITPSTVFLVNINHPDTYTDEEWELLNKNLQFLSNDWQSENNTPQKHMDAGLLQLAITFYQPEQNYEYILDLARKYSVFYVRYAPSHASAEKCNQYVDFEKLSKIKPTLMNFIRDTVDDERCPVLECVLPPCLFTVKEWRFLLKFTNKLTSICNPHMDILPNLDVIYCSSLMDEINRYKVGEYSPEEVYRRQEKQSDELREITLDRCEGCEFYEQRHCQGFCLHFKKDHN